LQSDKLSKFLPWLAAPFGGPTVADGKKLGLFIIETCFLIADFKHKN